jgi:hypothetical protein
MASYNGLTEHCLDGMDAAALRLVADDKEDTFRVHLPNRRSQIV